MEIKERVALAPRTTFEVGGAARYFCEATNTEELLVAYTLAAQKGVTVVVLGGGSNVVVPDHGIDALVVVVAHKGITREGEVVRAAAGESLKELIHYAAGAGLAGLEHLFGIPGSVGGAVRGNAGAFGSEIKDVLVSVRVFDSVCGEERVLLKDECVFAYRDSFFKQHPELVVIEATFTLAPKEPAIIKRQMEYIFAERTKRHIQDIKSAGSFFKNPVVARNIQQEFEQEKGVTSKEGRVPAGWLMDRAGLRGVRVGGAMASAHHTNYFLNVRGATAADVLVLAALAKERVRATFGVQLEEEVSILR